MKCVEEMSKVKLLEYNIEAITGGTEALAHVSLEVMDMDTSFTIRSTATHEDIVMSSVLALIKGLNLIVKHKAEKK
jgi:2-isopropylmalate synthase